MGLSVTAGHGSALCISKPLEKRGSVDAVFSGHAGMVPC